ncbi:MAG: hypothetical protein C0485_12175 [Pirellula sp.]|nr:hypothetical protein [Pirellula sp.]
MRWNAIVARLLLGSALSAAGATIATTSHAAVTTFFGGPAPSKLDLTNPNVARNAFLATLSSYGVENLETLGGQQNPTLTFGSTGVTAAAGFSNGVNSQFAYSVSGTNFLWDTEGVNDWLQFSQPVTGFGSYIVQGGDGSSAPPVSAPPNKLTFRLENTALGTSKDVVIGDLGPDWAFYNVVFAGVTDSEPFDRIALVESYDHDGLLWDDLIAGARQPTITGDFDGDGSIDETDLAMWQENFGASGSAPFTHGDGDGDGATTGADFLIWQRQLPTPLVQAVPEPAAGSLLIAAVVFIRRRRRAQA